MKTYSRPRPFVAITNRGTREALMSSSNLPTKKYITAMVGPFKTRRAQRLYRSQPGLFFTSVSQIERTAKISSVLCCACFDGYRMDDSLYCSSCGN